jgi:hypothetical protein
MKEQQLLRDPSIEPISEVITEGLGTANTTYLKFIQRLKQYSLHVNWRYYNDAKAWLGKSLYKWTTVRGTEKEVTVCWLSIWDGFFKVGILIREKARADALKLPLSDETKEMIVKAEQIGKMKIFSLGFNVRSDELLDDIFTLINFRKTIK